MQRLRVFLIPDYRRIYINTIAIIVLGRIPEIFRNDLKPWEAIEKRFTSFLSSAEI